MKVPFLARAARARLLHALALALSMGFIASACGGPRPGTSAWEQSVRAQSTDVTLVNRTRDTLEIRVTRDGKTETFGSVAPLSRMALTRLAPGPVVIELATFDGQVLHRHAVELVGGRPVTLDLEAPIATLEVVNPLDVDVDVLVDGRRVGRVSRGQTSRFDALPAGRRVLVARAVVGPLAIQQPQVLEPGQTFVWRLPQPEAEVGPAGGPTAPPGMALLVFTNQGSSEIELVVDEQVHGRVAPGQATQVPLTPGAHRVYARIPGTQIRTEQSLTVTSGQVARWEYGR